MLTEARPDYIVNGDMSNATPVAGALGATVVGPWLKLREMKSISFQVQWGGTPTGTWGFQVTNDADPTRPTGGVLLGPTTYPPTAAMTAANPAGGAPPAGGAWFEIPVKAVWGRLVYTRSAGGTASLNVAFHAGGV